MNFEFATATEIVFGWGRILELGKRALSLGSNALLVTGAHPERLSSARNQIETAGIRERGLRIVGEPTVDDVQNGVELARKLGIELVIAIGGGSVLDAGKAIAAIATNPRPVVDYLEVVGRALPLVQPSLPLVAVPTTAGTGSEVTRNAVLKVPENGVKVSLRGLTLLPRLALIDPELTVTVPRAVTAATGLDALTQVIEPYISKARGPMTDALCLEGIVRASRSLRAACADGSDRQAREDLAVTSLFGGLALANAKLGAVHGLAAPIGGRFAAPHGAICARLLPAVTKANLDAARVNQDADILNRLNRIAALLTGNATATAEDGIRWLSRLVEDLHIPRLAALGVCPKDVESLVEQARRASSMKGNPFELSADVLTEAIMHSL